MRRLLCLAVLAAAVWSGACAEIGTDPDAAVAIEFDSLVVPSIVRGDTLRDASGVVIPLVARAYNADGDPIPDAPITFLVLYSDTARTVREVGPDGLFVADSALRGPVRIIAQVGGLQSVARTLQLTLRPDTVFAAGDTSLTLAYDLPLDSLLTSGDLRVGVRHRRPPAADTAVASYLVSYELTDAALQPVDTGYAALVSEQGRVSTVDTTGADGVAARRVRVRIARLPSGAERDTLLVRASATYRGAPVPGGPVRFTLLIQPKPTS